MSWAEEQSWFGLEDLVSETSSVEFITIPAWRIADGTLIAIRDMSTTHIENCIKKIYKSNSKWRYQYLELFEAELQKRKILVKPEQFLNIKNQQKCTK